MEWSQLYSLQELISRMVVELVRIIGDNLVEAQDNNANEMVFISWLEALTSDVTLEEVKIARKSL